MRRSRDHRETNRNFINEFPSSFKANNATVLPPENRGRLIFVIILPVLALMNEVSVTEVRVVL